MMTNRGNLRFAPPETTNAPGTTQNSLQPNVPRLFLHNTVACNVVRLRETFFRMPHHPQKHRSYVLRHRQCTMRSQLLYLAVVGVCLVQLAFAWTATSLPDPQKNFDQCGYVSRIQQLNANS